MIIEKTARETLTAVELDVGDELHFTLADGQTRKILIHRTQAYVYETNLDDPKVGNPGGTFRKLHALPPITSYQRRGSFR